MSKKQKQETKTILRTLLKQVHNSLDIHLQCISLNADKQFHSGLNSNLFLYFSLKILYIVEKGNCNLFTRFFQPF